VLIASITSSATDTLTSFVGDHGVYALAGLMFVCALLPAFSELIMVYAGALASGAFSGQDVVVLGHQVPFGWQSYAVVVVAGTLGYLAGALTGWTIGSYGGRPLVERHGRWIHLSPERFARAERWFDRWGAWAVFLGQMTPVVRSFISIPAGALRYPLARFALLTLAGATLWSLVFGAIGWAAGASWETFHQDFRWVEYAIVALVVVGIAVLLLRWRSSRLDRRAEDPSR
jgi:membrane protein DedA with SNARE-associated domain